MCSTTLNINNITGNLPPNSGCLIAYSGGADSTALLHLFSKLENITAIHINHNINPNAKSWENHCRKTCEQLGIELIIEQAQLPDKSENSCRIARYEFFRKHLKENQILLTAHHAQDQAETILLKLFRGSGLKGLSGMEQYTDFAQGKLYRPLLDISPQKLRDYLVKNNINWIEDDSNLNNNYRRNFLRNQVFPEILKQFPDAIEKISQSGKNLKTTYDWLNELSSSNTTSLKLETLNNTDKKYQSTLLYQWLSQKNIPLPDKSTIQQIVHDFTNAANDKNPHFRNKYYQLIRFRDEIFCIQNYQKIDEQQVYEWQSDEILELPNGCVTLQYLGKKSLKFTIKFNQCGQKIKLSNRNITKSVKNLFQENQVPPWIKHNTPFIYHNNQLISLGFLWLNTKEFENQFNFIPANLVI